MSTKDNYIAMKAQSGLELCRDRLDSWKEIAVYLDREVRTVQRWEKREGLPVHRQFHVKAGTVWAFKNEIDTWFKGRCRVLSKRAPQRQHSDQVVDWSSPTLLLARQTGNTFYVWLVVALGSHRLDGDPSVVTIDKMTERLLQQTKIRTQGLRTTTRDRVRLSRFVACACPRGPATLARVLPNLIKADGRYS